MPTPSSGPPPELPSSDHSSSCPDELRASRRDDRDDSEQMNIDGGHEAQDPVNTVDTSPASHHDSGAETRSNTESPRPESRSESTLNSSQSSGAGLVEDTPQDLRKQGETGPQPQGHGQEAAAQSSTCSALSRRSPAPPFDMTSPVSMDGEKREEARSSESLDAGADDFGPTMGYEFSNTRISPISSSSFLRPGSKFHGTQQSERQIYDVQVEIKYVDLRESFLCGYLRIQGLTEDNPTLTTYFEGEIIGSKYGFITKHEDWGASEKVDLNHWNKFSAFRPIAKQNNIRKSDIRGAPGTLGSVASSSGSSSPAASPGYTGGQIKIPGDYTQNESLFMRWKEQFLVPDHRVKTINGASFEGFYYICFNQTKGTVSGIYFHSKSEKFQQLELKHVEDRGCFSAIEFR